MTGHQLRVCHVISGLSTGGAEIMLHKLLAWRGAGNADAVVSLRGEGVLGDGFRRLGVPLTSIGLGTGVPRWSQWRALRHAIAAQQPDVVLGWMYHANLAAQFASGGLPVVWGIRQSFGGYRRERLGTSVVIRLGALSSGRAAAILYNSHVSMRQHTALGYAADRARVIPNGFDIDRFHPDPTAGTRLRQDLGIAPDAVVVGSVARWHPMKNHAGMIDAVLRARAAGAPVHLVMAGTRIDGSNDTLATLVRPLADQRAISLLGERNDIPAVAAGFDLFCSASQWGEGFPNAVGEAMACGVPCVVTDIGDSGALVGDSGQVCAGGDVVALAAALLHWARMPAADRQAFGDRARQRVVAEYGIDRSGHAFYDTLAGVAATTALPAPEER